MLRGVLRFLGGIGCFLFGMDYMGQVVASFSHGGFKNLMKKFTSSVAKSFLSGIVTTSILQSSNVMSVLVLAFVGTGILSLMSALAVILGANVGTMLSTSILGVIGLSFDVLTIAFPLIFFGAIGMSFFSRWNKVVAVSKFLLSLGLIFLAFSYMKNGLSFLENIDFSIFQGMSPWFFLLFGLAITLLIQSGSMTFIIMLAMVGSGILDVNVAIPVIFGGYLGSTITIVLGAIGKGSIAIKRQVAIWHVGFNLITAISGILCLPLIIKLYMLLLPYLGSIISFTLIWIGWRGVFAIIFLPLVKPVSKLLEKIIKDKKQGVNMAIQKIIDVENLDPGVIQLAVKQDMYLLFWNAIKYNLNVWDCSPVPMLEGLSTEEKLVAALSFKGNFDSNDLSKVYHDVKYIQNQLIGFIVSLPVSEKSQENAELYQSVLDVVDSCKTIKDVRTHIEDWQWSSSDKLQEDYESTRSMVIEFYSTIIHLYQHFDVKKAFSDAQDMLGKLQKENDEYLAQLRPHKNDDIPLTALIQTRRYLVQSCSDLLHAMELFKAGPDEIKYFKENKNHFIK